MKTHFVHISDTVADISFSCPFFNCHAVKLFEVLAHYANTGKETLSPFTWQQYRYCSAPD